MNNEMTMTDIYLMTQALQLYINACVCEDTAEAVANEQEARKLRQAYVFGDTSTAPPRHIAHDALQLLRDQAEIRVATAKRDLELIEDLERKVL